MNLTNTVTFDGIRLILAGIEIHPRLQEQLRYLNPEREVRVTTLVPNVIREELILISNIYHYLPFHLQGLAIVVRHNNHSILVEDIHARGLISPTPTHDFWISEEELRNHQEYIRRNPYAYWLSFLTGDQMRNPTIRDTGSIPIWETPGEVSIFNWNQEGVGPSLEEEFWARNEPR